MNDRRDPPVAPGMDSRDAPAVVSGEAAPDTIPTEIIEELEKLGVDTSDQNVHRAIEIALTRSYSGPLWLPPAFVLAEYQRDMPDVVTKMIEWTDQQIAHRQSIERMSADRSERRSDRSQAGSLAVALVGLICATVAAVMGATVPACVIAIVAVGGPLAAYALAERLNIGGHPKSGD